MREELRIALPKGRLSRPVLSLFARAGIVPSPDPSFGRKLVLELPNAADVLGRRASLLLLKNADVPIYVEHGVADVGVCGTDVLDEARANVLRPFTFDFGRCRVALAARVGTTLEELQDRPYVRVATKFPVVAARHLERLGWTAELVHLKGSVELGAVLGLADAIIDLVDTGQTLAENQLEVLEVLDETYVKLIANEALTGGTAQIVSRLVDALAAASSAPPPAP